MKKNTLEQWITNIIIGMCCVAMVLVGVRLFAKLILVNEFNLDSPILRIIADYSWGDLQEKQPKEKAEIPSEELAVLEKIYENIPDDKNEEKLRTSMAEKIENKVSEIENNITTYTNKKFIGYIPLENISKITDKILGWEIVYAREDGTDYILNTGSKYTSAELADMTEKSNKVWAIAESAAANDADFLFVQLPYKVDANKTQVPWGASAYENENADQLLELLQQQEIKVLDLREALDEDGFDTNDGFYVSDGHWTVNTAFQATGLIAKHLNERYDYQYDIDFYYNIDNYEVHTYETHNLDWPDDVDLLLPSFDTNLHFMDAYRNEEYSGSFEQSCMDMKMADTDARSTVLTIYMANRIRNSYLAEIENLMETDNAGKRILIISSSFGWYIASYLALDTEKVDYTYYYDEPEKLNYIVEQLDPDLVMMIDY